jgi:N-acetylglutamate synthase-like GNAT family acetyltransferase
MDKETTNFLLSIRRAQLSDAEAISELVLRYYSPIQWEVFASYYSIEAVQKKIQTQDVFCGEIDGKLAGTVAMENAFVLGFYTHNDFLGRGIGTQMMEYLEIYARSQGIKELQLAASPVGVAYYLKHGWTSLDEEDFFYEGVLFRETRMKKTL